MKSTKLTRQQMLKALLNGNNEKCYDVARNILIGKTSIEEERCYSGSFLSAVLDDDYHEAYMRADPWNRKAFDQFLQYQ